MTSPGSRGLDAIIATLPRQRAAHDAPDAQERHAHVQDAAAALSWRAVDHRRVPQPRHR